MVPLSTRAVRKAPFASHNTEWRTTLMVDNEVRVAVKCNGRQYSLLDLINVRYMRER